MIVGSQKPLAELLENLAGYRHILLASCGTCVTVCFSGGEAQAEELAAKLRLTGIRCDLAHPVRQCDMEFLAELEDAVAGVEAIVSLGCGAGVQFMAERWPDLPVLPGLNTSFIGVNRALGDWTEMCQGCGNCLLDKTGGICPVSRCAKSNFNGPCGGSSGGHCEINPETDCAWQLIYDRLKRQNKLENLYRIQPPRDWSSARDGGPRRLHRPALTLEDADE